MSDVREWTRAASEDEESPAALMLYQSEDKWKRR